MMTVTILVSDLTFPFVNIATTATGSNVVGDELNITCRVTTLDRLAVAPVIEWVAIRAETPELSTLPTMYADGSASSGLILVIDPVMFSNRGVYVCNSSVNTTNSGYYGYSTLYSLSVKSKDVQAPPHLTTPTVCGDVCNTHILFAFFSIL